MGADERATDGALETGLDETHKERVDRELIELLNELRVALPGVQVLFAFLLTLPFTSRFGSLTGTQRAVYFLAFLLTAIATTLLMEPTAYHRIRFREGDKERMVRTTNRLAIAGLACLALAVGGVVYLVSDVLYGVGVAGAIAVAVFAGMAWCWFGLPLVRRSRDE